jgi:hypothetical protein
MAGIATRASRSGKSEASHGIASLGRLSQSAPGQAQRYLASLCAGRQVAFRRKSRSDELGVLFFWKQPQARTESKRIAKKPLIARIRGVLVKYVNNIQELLVYQRDLLVFLETES